MKKFLKKIKEVMLKEMDLHTRLFKFCCIAGVVASFSAFIATVAGELPFAAVVSSFLCFLSMAVFCIYCVLAGDTHAKGQRIAISVMLNFLLFPILFFTSGGVESGMIFYFLMGSYLISLLLEGKSRNIMLVLSLGVYAVVLWIGFVRTEWIIPIEEGKRAGDVISSFLIVSACMAVITHIVIKEYEEGNKKIVYWNSLLTEQSRKDGLTELYNRRYIEDVLTKWIQEKRFRMLAVLFCDIDDFKLINDQYGHLEGDRVLMKIAEIMQEEAREKGFAGRYGGEELIVVFYDVEEEGVREAAERIRRRVAEGNLLMGSEGKVSISGGISVYKEGMTVESLLEEADKKMYQAKLEGKNRIVR